MDELENMRSCFANMENVILHECVIAPSHLLVNLPDTVKAKCSCASLELWVTERKKVARRAAAKNYG